MEQIQNSPGDLPETEPKPQQIKIKVIGDEIEISSLPVVCDGNVVYVFKSLRFRIDREQTYQNVLILNRSCFDCSDITIQDPAFRAALSGTSYSLNETYLHNVNTKYLANTRYDISQDPDRIDLILKCPKLIELRVYSEDADAVIRLLRIQMYKNEQEI